MDKESIYRIIGYQGKYTENVKRALRKLLKENHPDHHGDKEIFNLINEVKNELEKNQVSFKWNENFKKKYEDIDVDYCHSMIKKLEVDREKIIERIEKNQEKEKSCNSNYKNLYTKSINAKEKVLNSDTKKLNDIKKISITLLIFLIILFVFAIITKSIVIFIIFGIMCIGTIMIISKYFEIFRNISLKSEKNVKNYASMIEEIKSIIDERQKIVNTLTNETRNLKKVENDLRFYNNLLK